MEDDWDLHAVVRSCCASTSSSSAAATDKLDYDFSSARFQDLFEPTRDLQSSTELDLHDLCKPFLASQKLVTVSPQSLPVSPQSLPVSQLSVLGRLQDPSSEQQIVKNLSQQTQFQQKQQPFTVLNVSKASSTHNPSSRSKKRKNSLKKVCHVAAENLSSDMWSWRKYGQKPIKGSPYPRGYYRCSTSKGCMARKQVERNRSDPGMFIVTYTAEHNHPMPTHRNSLAGSTRLKPMAETTLSSDDPKKPSCSQEMSPVASLSPATEKPESSRDEMADAEDMDDDDGFSGSDMVVDDDFFAGLEDFTATDGGECFSGHFPANLQFPWLASKAATSAAGGG